MAMNSHKSPFILLFFVSGFCNLMYEVVWTRMLNLVFGVTVFAVSTVLASFMLGLAAGSIVFGGIIDKAENRIALFSFLHFGIFVSSIVVLLIFPLYQDLYLFIDSMFHPGFYTMRVLLFFFSLLFLIVPTFFMGATFPVASKLLAPNGENVGKAIGVLYSAGTLGSVIGCGMTIFFFLGAAGMKGTICIAAGTDLLIGLVALALRKSRLPTEQECV
jgi:spermidine synthase